MTDKFTEGTAVDITKTALEYYNETMQIMNRGNFIPELTTAQTITARAAEVAAGRNYNAQVINTTRGDQLEYWDNTNNGTPFLL